MAARRNSELEVTAVGWERCLEIFSGCVLKSKRLWEQPAGTVGKGETLFSLGKFVSACFLLTLSSPMQICFLHPEVALLSQGYICTFSGCHPSGFFFFLSSHSSSSYSLGVSSSRKTSLTLQSPRVRTAPMAPSASLSTHHMGLHGPE